jgi:hypothetical protein
LYASLSPFLAFPLRRHYFDFVEEEVEIDTLDNVLDRLNIDKIDFLKIDIEGSEHLALKGGIESIKKTKNLMIEIMPENLWLIRWIKKLGFSLLDIHGIPPNLNYFFICKS